MADVFLSDFWQ